MDGGRHIVNFLEIKHVAFLLQTFPSCSASTLCPCTMHSPPLVAFLLLPLALTHALRFELHAQAQPHISPRCIRNYVAHDTLVVVTAVVSGKKGDGQQVNIDVPSNVLGVKTILTSCRFEIQRETSMGDQGTLLGNKGWHLLPMA